MSGSAPTSFFRETRDGIDIFVRLTPKSSADAVEGPAAGPDARSYLKARVRAVPEDGKANRALEILIARWLGQAPRDVSVTSGATSRLKTVSVTGDAGSLIARLNVLVRGGEG